MTLSDDLELSDGIDLDIPSAAPQDFNDAAYPAPSFLREKRVWVMWKYITINDRKTKVPFTTNGHQASTTKASTWTSYMSAVLALENDKDTHAHHFDGIGVCFDGSFTGVDIDHCVEDGIVNDVAKDVIAMLDSYTELSPSKTGVHILVEGVIEQTRNRRKDSGIEMYSKGRYFTFTAARIVDCPQEMKVNVEGLRKVYAKYLYQVDVVNEPSDCGTTVRDDNVVDAHDTINDSTVVSDAAIEEVMKRMRKSPKWAEIESLMSGEGMTTAAYDDSSADLSFCNHLAYWTRRNINLMDAIFRTTKLMRPKWDEIHGPNTYGLMTMTKACTGTRSVDGEESAFRYTEDGNANRFAQLHGRDLKYCNHQATWYIWDGGRWAPDMTQLVFSLSRDVVKQLYAEARAKVSEMEHGRSDPKTVQLVSKFAKTTDTARGLINTVKLAQSLPELTVAPVDMDNKPMMLNTIGTTLNFATPDELIREPTREDLITKQCGTEFDFDATCPNWEKFVSEIFNNDQDLMNFVQKAVGYSLTGKVSEKCFFFCWGEGSNGKTVFLNVLRAVFGDYGQQASIKTFLKKKGDSEIRDDLVNLKGARFVSAVEPDDNARFDMEVMKPLTGNDPIRCRTLHQRQIEYLPEAHLWIAGNNKPLITETNTGAWDRVRLVPFTVSFIGREDRKLEDRLRTELPGILNWCIKGYKMYLQGGLHVPQCVKVATEAYKVECNTVLSFVETLCVRSTVPMLQIRSSQLYEAYREHCLTEGQMAYGNKRFKKTLLDSGIQVAHTRSGEFYFGICTKVGAVGQCIMEDDNITLGKLEMPTPERKIRTDDPTFDGH